VELINVCDRAYFDKQATIAPVERGTGLIFIVGMPRSGSTLVEQILASHRDVYAGGERRDIKALPTELCQAVNLAYPLCLRSLDSELADRLAKGHLERVWHLAQGRRWFVDKCLMNFVDIGMIVALFPAARIVHSIRNPLDTCLSCYFGDFEEVNFTHDLETLGKYYRWYERVMSHWHACLPGRILDFHYESLVNEPESQIRLLLDYCGIPWDDACLKPHETTRAVFTLSANQVKAPISAKSVGRWKNYQQHLGPLFRGLGVSPSEIGQDSEVPVQDQARCLVKARKSERAIGELCDYA
jgi:hypothetical protein